MTFKNFIQSIFSIKNVDYHKQIMVVGFKFKFKTKKLTLQKELDHKYKNYAELSYDVNRQEGIDVRNAWNYSPEITGQLQYHILNKLKEIELKRKVREGKKVRVAFFLDTIQKFSANSVYWIMKNHPLFEPFVLLGCADELNLNKDSVWQKHRNEYETLISNGYKAYSLYDENRNYIPIEKFKPDIIMSTVPYLEFIFKTHLSNIYLNINFLVCHMRYGFPISNSYYYLYNNRRINTTWKHFVFTREEYAELMKYSKDCGLNTVLTGYPKLDAYSKPFEQCKIPQKLDNGNPIVIYAPHWTVVHGWEPNDWGTFDIYKDYFINLVDRYPNINFVFRPHPSLSYNLFKNEIMTYEEFDDYIEQWDSKPNGMYIMDGEYIDLFRKSSLMITDSGSFIAEYLLSDNPCMYLVKPSRDQKRFMDGFSIGARNILEKYYLCHNEIEIEKYFKMIMVDKNDPMRDERIKLKNEMFINIGCAGQKVVDYLEDILTESDEVKL